jgi:23S rRNA (uridine2552-2'-O)-methyltransferase
MAKPPGTSSIKNKSGGSRAKHQKVKTARSRSLSSARWLERQLNDPYVRLAKQEGYRSRAAYKLLEMQEAKEILKPGQIVVDLGAAPGGWSQIAALLVKSPQGKGRVIALDILPIEPLPGVEILQGDFTEEPSELALAELLKGQMVDVVLSDMAAPTTGHAPTDHLRIMHLCDLAYDFAEKHLQEGGAFVAKIFQGGTQAELLQRLKKNFTKVKHIKPESSRKESTEMYVVATNFQRAKNEFA